MSDKGSTQNTQWLRKVELVVLGAGGGGKDLSTLRVHFIISQSDFETPNNAVIRVFNLSDQTADKIKKEYTQVMLQAGYENGAFGIVFKGTIKQVRKGRENQTDTYLDIFAADSDTLYNFGMVNSNIAAGQSPDAQVKAIAKDMGAEVGKIKFDIGLQSNIRGKTLFGMARTQIRNLARSGLATWSLNDGKIVIAPLTGVADGEAVVINSTTGMVGLPQQTEDGIKVTTLLNPKIVIGTQVQINQSSVQVAAVNLAFAAVNTPDGTGKFNSAAPPVAYDGFYYVMVHEIEGDTRANEYYSNLTCLSVNKTVPQNQSVKPAG